LILVFIAAFGLALTASTVVLLLSINKLGLSSIQRQLDEEKMIIAQQLVDTETQLHQTASLVSQQPYIIENVVTNDLNKLESSLEIMITSLGHDVLWILDTSGQTIAYHSKQDESVTDENAVMDLSILQSSPSTGIYIVNQAYLILASSPIYSPDGNPIGFAVAGDVIDNQRLGAINFYRDSPALVMFPDTETMAGISANEANNLPHLPAQEVETLRLHGSMLTQVQNGNPLRIFDVVVRETFHAMIYLPFEVNGEYQGYYAIAVDENESRTIQATILIVSLGTIFVVLFLIGLLVVLSLWYVVLHPLQILSEATARFGEGKADTYIKPTSSDEIGQLYDTFNTMAERINLRTDELNTLNSQLETRVRERTEQVERQTLWLETIVCQATEAIIVSNADGNIAIINAMALSIMNLKETETLGLSLVELIQSVADHHVLLPPHNSEIHRELEIKDRFYQYSIAPIQIGSTDNMSGYVCILSDITTLRRFNNLQTQVIRLAAHDLRSPITALGLQFHLLRRSPELLSSRQHDILVHMEEIVVKMRNMINDLLNVERIEQQVSGICESVDFESLLSSSITLLETQFTQKQQKVSVEIEENLPLLCGDPVRLLEVLRNLLSNAYKYTPQGGEIILKAYVGEKGLHVDVSDSGIGISEDDIQHIFEEKFRAKTALDSGIEGLGVGLNLAREIILGHGGEISVSSQKGSGTRFSFYLPLP
jgi:signal transduction histidine kinase